MAAKTYVTRNIFTFDDKLTQKMKAVSRQLTSIGKSMTANVSAPIAAVGGGIAAAVYNFEKSMNGVKAVTGATGEDFKQMRDLAKQLGSTTQFSNAEAAQAMEFLGMAGWKTNEILSGTPGLLNLAAASNIELGRAADIASNVMGAFGIEANKVNNVADILAATTASANVDMEMLAETMKYAAPIAKQAGASLEDTAAAAGFLGNIGIQGSMAGTAIKSMFNKLAAPSEKASGYLRKMGVAIKDSSGNMRPLTAILSEVSAGMADLGSADKLAVLNELFGERAMAGASNLADLSKQLEQYGESLKNVKGRAQEMAETRMDGMVGALELFKSSVQGLAVAIGDAGFTDFLNNLGRGIADITSKFTAFAEANPQIVKMGLALAGVAAVTGPLLISLGAIAKLVALISVPVVAATAAVVGIGLAFKHAMDTGHPLIETISRIGEMLGAGALRIAEMVGWTDEASGSFGFLSGVLEAVADALNLIAVAIEGALRGISGVVGAAASIFEGDFGGAISSFSDAFDGFGGVAMDAIRGREGADNVRRENMATLAGMDAMQSQSPLAAYNEKQIANEMRDTTHKEEVAVRIVADNLPSGYKVQTQQESGSRVNVTADVGFNHAYGNL